MNSPVLIAIVGMPGAGKSIAADFFRSKNIPVLRFGDQVDIGLAENKLERNEKNERWYREKLRSELGMNAMAVKIEPRILDAAKTNRIIALDGLYSWEEYIYVKDKFPDIRLLCIYTRPSIRHLRLKSRSLRPLSEAESASRDRAELENLNKGGPIAIADYLIKNESSKEHLIAELEMYLKSEI